MLFETEKEIFPMSIFKSLTGLILIMAVITSCKKTTISTDENLLGQWTVVKVQGQQFTNGVPGIVLTDTVPTGYIRFDDNGWGEQNYSFRLFGVTYPFNDTFKWSSNTDEIRIDLFSNPDMIWTRKINEPGTQEATYTIVISATQTIEYTLTLEK
jgi:hypothetical protein